MIDDKKAQVERALIAERFEIQRNIVRLNETLRAERERLGEIGVALAALKTEGEAEE